MEIWIEFNPHHDANGRFTSAPTGGRRGPSRTAIALGRADDPKAPKKGRKRRRGAGRDASVPGVAGLKRLMNNYKNAKSPAAKKAIKKQIKLKVQQIKLRAKQAKLNKSKSGVGVKKRKVKLQEQKAEAKRRIAQAKALSKSNPAAGKAMMVRAKLDLQQAKLKYQQAKAGVSSSKVRQQNTKLALTTARQAMRLL